MEEKVLTLSDIGVTALHIGYNEDRSKAVIEINRVDKDRETLSKLKTLKYNFKFRPTGQKSLYEIESIETFEHFYRLFCTRVEERDAPKVSAVRNDDGSVTFSVPTLQGVRIREDAVPVFVSHAEKPVKEAMPKYVINIETVFGSFSDTSSFDGLIYECKLNANAKEALSLLYKNKDSVLLVVSGYAPVYRAVRADLDSEEKKIKIYLSIYACYNNVRKDVTWLHSLEDLKAIGDGSKVLWNAGMLTYKVEDAMPKGATEAGRVFDERVMQELVYERLLKDYAAEPKLVGKLCSSKDSAPTTRRINIVKLNKVTRL